LAEVDREVSPTNPDLSALIGIAASRGLTILAPPG
jgi:hypothetical protein